MSASSSRARPQLRRAPAFQMPWPKVLLPLALSWSLLLLLMSSG